MKSEGLLEQSDIEALDDDILFILHKVTVSNEVYETLIVLTRLLNNADDKKIRDKYKLIKIHQSKNFPFDTRNFNMEDPNDITTICDNPVFIKIIELANTPPMKKPFEKAILEF